jgi:hypothetical protein
MKRRLAVCALLGLMYFATASAHAAETACREKTGGQGQVRAVAAAAETLQKMLTPAQHAVFARPLTRDTATRWSNLPVGIVPREGLRVGDLDAAQSAAAHRLAAAALSACGLTLWDEIRTADDFLTAVDQRKLGWSGANYYMSVLGTPSRKKPWMLQMGGHHIAYNFTFNGGSEGATPLFFGTEPIRFTFKDATHEPLAAQSSAMARLASALATHPQAKLSGTFTDVVKGVVMVPAAGKTAIRGIDSGFPHSYPTGSLDRGILHDALNPDERALVRAALESYASLPGEAITKSLVAAYEAPDALAQTYIGFSGSPALTEKGSYVRIDGPRIWMEFVVQPAVGNPAELHYHALWRDKLSDYGGQVAR